MHRRDFASLVSILAAESALPRRAAAANTPQAALAKPVTSLHSGVFVAGPEHLAGEGRVSQAFLTGMLSPGLRLEAHETVIEPGAPPEETRKHVHHEIWLMKEGTVELWADGISSVMRHGDLGLVIAGTMHHVRNVGAARAAYFVLAVGPPE